MTSFCCFLAIAGLLQLSAAAAAPASSAPQNPPASPSPPKSSPLGDTAAARALREERVGLDKLLAALAKRSETYRSHLLRFVCEETLIRSEYSTLSGRRQKEEVQKYDYLLGRSSPGEVRERRRPSGGSGGSWAHLSLSQPEPYRWSLLFTPDNQRLFNYRLQGQEVVHFRLATVLEFDAILPFVDGSAITQWSGRAYVDAETLDLLRVEAEPSGQQIRLEAASRAYQQAFRLAGVPLRRRPRAHLHEVDFTYEREGLRLPALAITRRYVSTEAQERTLHTQVMQIFSDYQLFKVETDEQLLRIRGEQTP
ncbi:MAG: hypothetical protein L0Z62_18125 [Gemmataceae bacterium]|nr:hypothetical protein [Gemmataceae bacterium]